MHPQTGHKDDAGREPTAAAYPDSARFVRVMLGFAALALTERLPRRWALRLRRRINAAVARKT